MTFNDTRIADNDTGKEEMSIGQKLYNYECKTWWFEKVVPKILFMKQEYIPTNIWSKYKNIS